MNILLDDLKFYTDGRETMLMNEIMTEDQINEQIGMLIKQIKTKGTESYDYGDGVVIIKGNDTFTLPILGGTAEDNFSIELLEAIIRVDKEEIERLLELNALSIEYGGGEPILDVNFNKFRDPDAPEGITIFTLAVCGGETPDEIINKLIENGANVNVKDSEGNTPLHFVCANIALNPLNSVRILIKAGASVSEKNNRQETPLHLLVKYLCEYGDASYRKTPPKSIECAELMRKADPTIVNIKDSEGDTPLSVYSHYPGSRKGLFHSMAYNSGQIRIPFINFLIEAGSDIYAENNEGNKPADDHLVRRCYENYQKRIEEIKKRVRTMFHLSQLEQSETPVDNEERPISADLASRIQNSYIQNSIQKRGGSKRTSRKVYSKKRKSKRVRSKKRSRRK